jgi:hypothetical protein
MVGDISKYQCTLIFRFKGNTRRLVDPRMNQRIILSVFVISILGYFLVYKLYSQRSPECLKYVAGR